MTTLEQRIKEAKARRKATRDDLVRAEDKLEELDERREAGEKGLTPRMNEIRKTRDQRKEDWIEAKEQVKKLRKLKVASLDKITLDRHDGHSGIETFFFDYVDEFMADHGLAPGSRVRSASHNAAVGGSPNSDHLDAPNRFATDYPTFQGEAIARAFALSLGISSWSPNSYASHVITVDGVRMVIQILWGSGINHADHIHVGAHLA